MTYEDVNAMKINIAICDDEVMYLDEIANWTMEYFSEHHLETEVFTYENPAKFLTGCEKTLFHIMILDIVMPAFNGIHLAVEARQFGQDGQIIFCTSEPSYALDSFSVNPLDYLVKPVKKNRLFKALDMAMLKMKREAKSLLVKTKEGIRPVKFAEIISCEYKQRKLNYRLATGEILRTSIIEGRFTDNVSMLLADPRFVHCHSSYVVNLEHVQCLSREGVTLENEYYVPVSAKRYKDVKRQYVDYFGGKEYFEDND